MKWETKQASQAFCKQELLLPDEKAPERSVQLCQTPPKAIRPIISRSRRVIMLAIALGCSLVSLSRSFASVTSGPDQASVCLTPACVLASAELLSSRSPHYTVIDPCDDFHTYMCEGFVNAHDMRPDQGSVGSLSLIAERGNTVLRHILDAPLPKDRSGKHASVDEENFEKLHDAYAACMDEEAIQAEGSAPLVKLVQEAMRIVEKGKSAEGEMVWSEVLSFLMSIGVEPLLTLDISADERHPDVNVLHMTAPSLGLPAKEYYEDKAVVEKYTNMIMEVTDIFKHDMNTSTMFTSQFHITQMIELEVKLAAASPTQEEREDVQKSYNPYSLDEAISLIPQVNLPDLIRSQNAAFEPQTLVIGKPSYFQSLSKILKETDSATIESYLLWRTILSYSTSVESAAVVPLRRFFNVLGGKAPDAKPDRWRNCLSHVNNGLGWILSRLFIQKAFSEEARMFGDQVILDIKSEFTRKLAASEWMSEEVRSLAIDKVHNIVQKIGYPTVSPDLRDPNQLQEYYVKVNISGTEFFNNALSISRDDVAREWGQAKKPVDRDQWGMTASTVNAYYNPAGNEIVFPAGIMQAPIFYPPEIPQYMTYAAFGAVSGHELSHAFDSTGRHFDQNGNYTDWWDSSTVAEFKRKAECFVEEYGNFTIDGPDGKPHHVNGRLTLGENLADAGGLSAAFNAWKRREAEKPAQLLPGLQEYTKEQAFFLSFGNVWCGKTREAEQLRRLYDDPHSPDAARIMLTVANSKEFRETFGCKQKQATCKLW